MQYRLKASNVFTGEGVGVSGPYSVEMPKCLFLHRSGKGQSC